MINRNDLFTNKMELIQKLLDDINNSQDKWNYYIQQVVENDVAIYDQWTINKIRQDETDPDNYQIIAPYTTLDELLLLEKSQELMKYVEKLPSPMKKMLAKKGIKL